VGLGDRIAPWLLDAGGRSMEKKPEIAAGRKKLVAPAEGRILEVGAGTGFNLPCYPADATDVTLTDGLGGMLSRVRKRAGKLGRTVATTTASVESLPFEDGTFDTVVASLLLCSVDDQDKALAEIKRVPEPGGRYLFIEHVRSDDPKVAKKQDSMEGFWKTFLFGCHPNRDTLPRIEATFDVEVVEQGELSYGPKIVRPYVLGRAIASTPV
jgi:ubiquinone/menaquinone biosynthesis C-methylase UbiE